MLLPSLQQQFGYSSGTGQLRREWCPARGPQPPHTPHISLPAGASSWAIRSKASLLLALVIKRTGPQLWEAALPQLLQAAATEGPAMQEQVRRACVAAVCGSCLRHHFPRGRSASWRTRRAVSWA